MIAAIQPGEVARAGASVRRALEPYRSTIPNFEDAVLIAVHALLTGNVEPARSLRSPRRDQ